MTSPILLDSVDQQIYECLNLDQPRSFFLFAGAGSGKTRSLVNVLKKFRMENIQRLRLAGQKVAVITYTNAACDEIKSRLEYDPSFAVSTIHSFSWALINPYRQDIKEWLRKRLKAEIADLEDKQSRGRASSKAAIDRPRQIESKKNRLASLDTIKKFIYSPDGENTEWNALNHAEVISMTAELLQTRPLLKSILIRKHPILFIDESQDTNAELMESIFQVQAENAALFTLGLFGDRMQRIYLDGKKDLGNELPADWIKPAKTTNYRCPKRVIKLINQIRSPLKDPPQEPGPNNPEGYVRLFITNSNSVTDRFEFENWVSQQMSTITGDASWSGDNADVKILTLEHLMAARRGGFDQFFEPLYQIGKFKTGLLNGKLPGISLFSNLVLPVFIAMQLNNKFEVARIIREHSPLLAAKTLQNCTDQIEQIRLANQAVISLMKLWEIEIPAMIEILKEIHRSGLFTIPERLLPIAKRLSNEISDTVSLQNDVHEADRDEEIDAWDKALSSTFDNFIAYVDYISDKSRFGTHQGIKGREFPRVMVILNDEEAGGFLFKYNKLLGAEDQGDTDRRNERDGKETTIERTHRLFYVTCSRAEKSLAIVAYTSAPEKVRNSLIANGWLSETEIILYASKEATDA